MEVVRALIAAGADVNKTANNKSSFWAESRYWGYPNAPLHVAVKSGCIPVIKELIAHGADIRDSNNEDALYCALYKKGWIDDEFSKHEIIKLLISLALLENPDRKIDYGIRNDNDLLTTWNAVSQEITVH